jgi:hypothetical protein
VQQGCQEQEKVRVNQSQKVDLVLGQKNQEEDVLKL